MLHHLAIPLKGRFHTAMGDIGERDISILELSIDDVVGWGEASPYPGLDEPFAELLTAAASHRTTPTLASAIELASADVSARVAGTSFAEDIGATRESVPASIAVGLGGDPSALVASAAHLGVQRFKVKIAPGHVLHVAEIMDSHPGTIIGLDANGSFDMATIGELESVADLPIAYLEQPCDPSDPATLERLKQITDVPVFIDETIRTAKDAAVALDSTLVDGVVIKPGRLGLAASLATIEDVERRGKRWRSSGLLETGVGRAFSDAFAAIPSAFASDIAPADWFLERDIVENRFSDGAVSIPKGPGIGMAPDPEVLDRYRVSSIDVTDTVNRWLAARSSG